MSCGEVRRGCARESPRVGEGEARGWGKRGGRARRKWARGERSWLLPPFVLAFDLDGSAGRPCAHNNPDVRYMYRVSTSPKLPYAQRPRSRGAGTVDKSFCCGSGW